MTGSSSNLAVVENVPTETPQWESLRAALEFPPDRLGAQFEWWDTTTSKLREKIISARLPSQRLENWKYTSLSEFQKSGRQVRLTEVGVTAPAGVKVLRLTGSLALSTSDLGLLRSLLEADDDIYFEGLAKTLVTDPVVVVVPKDFRSETPIEIHWNGGEGWGFGVVAVVIGAGAEVTLVERYGFEIDAQTNVTMLAVSTGARLSHLRLQAGENKVERGFVFSTTRAKVFAGAAYETAQVSLGSRLSREDLVVELCERGAEAHADGVFIGRANQVLDHHTNLVHRVGDTTSRQIYKGILSGESRGVFNGRIAIAKNASGSNSSQMNKNLLLSKKVELDTKPQLEIDNDDVKAAHGAAIGRLDAEHIFYLRSRGISAEAAVGILARGFANEAVQRLSSSKLQAIGIRETERGLAGLSLENV